MVNAPSIPVSDLHTSPISGVNLHSRTRQLEQVIYLYGILSWYPSLPYPDLSEMSTGR